jgi:hypothetical protein
MWTDWLERILRPRGRDDDEAALGLTGADGMNAKGKTYPHPLNRPASEMDQAASKDVEHAL